MGCSKIGFAKSRKEVLVIVKSLVAKKQGKDPQEILVRVQERVDSQEGETSGVQLKRECVDSQERETSRV